MVKNIPPKTELKMDPENAPSGIAPPPIIGISRKPLTAPPGSGHLFTVLVDESPNAILRIAKDGTILYGNASAADWFNLFRDSITGTNVKDLSHLPHHEDFWSDLLSDACDRGITRSLRTAIYSKIGLRVVEIHTRRETDGATDYDAVVATIRDVTNQSKVESSLELASQHLVFHLNNSPLAVMEWDSFGTILTWNDEAERLFGWTQQEASRKFNDAVSLIQKADRPRFFEALSKLREGSETRAVISCRTLSSTNSISYCDWYLSSLLDDSGKSKSILCLVNDCTERELSERKLQTIIASLEKKIELRSKLLETAQQNLQRQTLVRSQLERDMIGISERAHRRIGHDLHDGICQELAGLRFAITAMAASAPQDCPSRARLLRIEDAVLRAMNETRLLSRGLAPLELDNGDLGNSLSEFAQNTSTLHGISCRIRWRGHKTTFPAETATHIFRIAQEAVHNAIHHGEATRIDIKINISERLIRLIVDDNGKGLSESPTPIAPLRGMGSKIMQHRASIIGGVVTLTNHPNGQGARLICSCPRINPPKSCPQKNKPRSESKSSKTTH